MSLDKQLLWHSLITFLLKAWRCTDAIDVDSLVASGQKNISDISLYYCFYILISPSFFAQTIFFRVWKLKS